MKKTVILFAIVFVIYFFFKFIIHDFIMGHDFDYEVKSGKDKFKINEVLNLKRKQGINNYYLTVTKKKTTYSFKVNNEFHKNMKIVKDIKYYKDKSYECILPIFKKDKVLIDMMCYYQDNLYYYHTLPEKSSKLETFAEKSYNPNRFVDNGKKIDKKGSLTTYNNLIEGHYLASDNYHGLYLIDENGIQKISLFEDDVYEANLKTLVDKYYVIADYNKKHDFNNWLMVDITKGKQDELVINYDINFDSYINGVYKKSIFVTDRDSKVQYEINFKRGSSSIIGENNVLIYNGKEPENIEMSKALNNDIYFKTTEADSKKYDRLDMLNGKYYMYIKDKDRYHVYMAPVEKKNKEIYLFDTTDLSDIYYIDDYIYFKDKNRVFYYKEDIGKRIVLQDSEYEFNDSLKFYVYSK